MRRQLLTEDIFLEPSINRTEHCEQREEHWATFRSVFRAATQEDFDFSYGGAYAIYNWELFFHAPFLIAKRLSQNRRFEDGPALVSLHL